MYTCHPLGLICSFSIKVPKKNVKSFTEDRETYLRYKVGLFYDDMERISLRCQSLNDTNRARHIVTNKPLKRATIQPDVSTI